MEIIRGPCITCSNQCFVSPITISKLFNSLFSKDVINVQLLKEKLPLLQFCHLCYHKLISLKEIHEKFTEAEWNVSESHCLICKTEDRNSLIAIEDWTHFSKISIDFKFPKEDKFLICLDCLFYLDTRNTLKEKLLAKFRFLRLGQSFTPSNSLKSIKRGNDASTKFIVLSSSEEDNNKSLDLSALVKFKSLKEDRKLKNLDFVANDPRFFSQVPYTLLQASSSSEKRKRPRPGRKSKIQTVLIHSDADNEGSTADARNGHDKTKKTSVTPSKRIKNRKFGRHTSNPKTGGRSGKLSTKSESVRQRVPKKRKNSNVSDSNHSDRSESNRSDVSKADASDVTDSNHSNDSHADQSGISD